MSLKLTATWDEMTNKPLTANGRAHQIEHPRLETARTAARPPQQRLHGSVYRRAQRDQRQDVQ